MFSKDLSTVPPPAGSEPASGCVDDIYVYDNALYDCKAANIATNTCNYKADSPIKYWDSQEAKYDFSTPVKNSDNEGFVKMIWRSTVTIGFGLRGKYMIGRFCEIPAVLDLAAMRKNIISTHGVC